MSVGICTSTYSTCTTQQSVVIFHTSSIWDRQTHIVQTNRQTFRPPRVNLVHSLCRGGATCSSRIALAAAAAATSASVAASTFSTWTRSASASASGPTDSGPMGSAVAPPAFLPWGQEEEEEEGEEGDLAKVTMAKGRRRRRRRTPTSIQVFVPAVLDFEKRKLKMCSFSRRDQQPWLRRRPTRRRTPPRSPWPRRCRSSRCPGGSSTRATPPGGWRSRSGSNSSSSSSNRCSTTIQAAWDSW